jgi:hypothetical protein
VRILNFSFSRPQLLLNLGAAVEYERASSSVTFLSKDLPTCAIDDVVKPTNCAVSTGGSLLPSHKTDISFKSAPIKNKRFLETAKNQNLQAQTKYSS